jgi:hypothetical protein
LKFFLLRWEKVEMSLEGIEVLVFIEIDGISQKS